MPFKYRSAYANLSAGVDLARAAGMRLDKIAN